MKRVKKPMLLLAILAIAALVAACGTPQPTEAPTAVGRALTSVPDTPTNTVTPAPTNTATPTATRVPTETPTPRPPTDTPPATATPIPAPSDTPAPTDTLPPPSDTPRPPTATVAQATAPPIPPTTTAPGLSWRGQVVNTFPNCALTRLMGLTLDQNGRVIGDVWVHWWADGWEGAWGSSKQRANEGYGGMDDSSNWDGILDSHPKAGTWHVCIVPAEGSWDCRSPTVTAQTVAEPCTPDSGGVQVVRIVFQQN